MLTSLGNSVSTCCRATRLLDWDLIICTLTKVNEAVNKKYGCYSVYSFCNRTRVFKYV